MAKITQLVIIQVTILHFTPKIEAYSQNAEINYFKSFAGLDVYVQPLGYKSYANLFYTDKTPNRDTTYNSFRTDREGRRLEPIPNEHWLLFGKTDRPVYCICKIQDSAKYTQRPMLTVTGSKNGYVFLKRNDR